MAYDVTDQEIQTFRDDGMLIVGRFIDDDTVAALHGRYRRLFKGEFETATRPDEVNWQEGESDATLTRQICNAWKSDRTVARVVLRQDFGRAIARLGGWPGSRIMIDNVLWKPPGARPLGHHQDSAYLSWFRPSDLISLWIALDDTSADAGTMELVSKSHNWAHALPEGEFHGPADYRRYMRLAAAREAVEPDIRYVEVARGGGSFHHGWTWHGSGDNRASHPRRSLVLHAMRSDVRYDAAHFDVGTGPIYSRYKHLADDTIDENHFPVLWREDGYRTPGLERYLNGG